MIADQARDILNNLESIRITRGELARLLDVTPTQLRDLLEMHGTNFKALRHEARVNRADELFGKVSQRELANAIGIGGDLWFKTFSQWRDRHGLDRLSIRHREAA